MQYCADWKYELLKENFKLTKEAGSVDINFTVLSLDAAVVDTVFKK